MRKILTLLLVAMLVISFTVSAYAAGSQVSVSVGTYSQFYNVTFSAGADTYYRMTHTLTASPTEFTITSLDANCASTVNAVGVYTTGMPYVNGAADMSSTTFGIAKNSKPYLSFRFLGWF